MRISERVLGNKIIGNSIPCAHYNDVNDICILNASICQVRQKEAKKAHVACDIILSEMKNVFSLFLITLSMGENKVIT